MKKMFLLNIIVLKLIVQN